MRRPDRARPTTPPGCGRECGKGWRRCMGTRHRRRYVLGGAMNERHRLPTAKVTNGSEGKAKDKASTKANSNGHADPATSASTDGKGRLTPAGLRQAAAESRLTGLAS